MRDARGAPRSPLKWRSRSLRWRVTAAFALGSLAIVGLLGVTTYLIAEHYLVRQREESLTRQAFVDARVLRDEIQRRKGVTDALGALDLGARSNVVLSIDGEWYGTSVSSGQSSVPLNVRRAVAAGRAVRQRTEVDGRPAFVVALPLPAIDTQYYETFALIELDRTLGILRSALAASGLLAIVVGGVLGWWMGRRVLRPVGDAALAAERVASGDLDTRMITGQDPDLDSLATSFNHMVDAVERRIERESRFVADVSHELRTPLTTLTTTTEIMRARRAEMSPKAARAFDLLETEVLRLHQLVEDLLELGRADAGVADVQLELVDVAVFVALTMPSCGGATATFEAPEHPTYAHVDKRRLGRVLANLVANAETHGGGLRRVVVSSGTDNSRVMISVEDSGCGIDPSEREAVFERFFRGAGGRRTSTGAGLGLSLVAEHVQLHGGRVWVEGTEGSGARFVVELPGTPQ